MAIEVDYAGIGRRIRYYRKLRDMSQEELAEKIDISTTHMSHIETANTKLSLPVFINIAHVLNVRADQLLRDEADPSHYHAEVEEIFNSASLQEQQMMFNVVQSIRQSFEEQ